jgi:anti-anti-sigma factor
MKSKIEKMGDTVVVKLDGKIDYESQEPFKESLRTIAKSTKTDSVPTKVIFNLERLEFVGSSGISQLIQTLKEFGTRHEQKAHIQNASNEFKKVMRAFDEEAVFEFQDQTPPVTSQKKRKTLDQ